MKLVISQKRLSAGGIEFARQGGACGRWVPHKAFRTPGHILTQASTLEQGQKLLTIARTHRVQRTQPAHYGTPIYAIALGCDLKYVKDICYADNIGNLKGQPLPLSGWGAGYVSVQTASIAGPCLEASICALISANVIRVYLTLCVHNIRAFIIFERS